MSKLLFLSLRQGELAPEIARAEYHDVLNAAGLSEVDVELKILDRVDEEVGSLETISGIIIGGSSLNVSNAEYSPWQRHINDVLAGVVESGLPVFFVCFGISWLVDHLGGTVGIPLRQRHDPLGGCAGVRRFLIGESLMRQDDVTGATRTILGAAPVDRP